MIKLENVKSPFMCYCAKVIPLAFDESMSYYECLCNFYNYLKNEIMPAINLNAEATKELQDKFIELQNYVDNYFENLDVQTEINNKLDEMAESGQLEEIIAEYLNLITNLVFDTVADMKEAENLVNGNYVKTLGFYEVGDGGSAYYHIRTVTTLDDIDEHFIFEVADPNLVAEFTMIEKDLHSKQIGLKGDDETDETEIIQKFFDYKNNYNINKIFDSGIYVISDTILVEGKDQQDGNDGSGYNNGYATIKFNDASFHHINASAGDYSFKFYKFWEDCIDGFSITRNSGGVKILFIGCYGLMFKNFEVKNIEFNTDPSLISEELRFYYDSEMYLENGYVRGQITYDPYNATTHFINVINFKNTKIYSYGYDSSLVLKKDYSKQQLTFNNCDISGATLSVIDVVTRQVNPYLTNAIGSCSIVAINNYYDSNIPMFKNNNHNNIRYSEFGTRYSGSYQQSESQTPEEYFSTTKVGITSNYGRPQLPISNLNLINNGNIKNHSLEYAQSERLFGQSTTDITKTYEASDYQRYGYVRRLTFNSQNDCYVTATGKKWWCTAPAVYGLLFQVVSGGADITLSVGNSNTQYTTFTNSQLKSGLNFISGTKNSQIFQQGSWCELKIQFTNLQADTVIDIYEVGVQQGEIYLLNAPCVSD